MTFSTDFHFYSCNDGLEINYRFRIEDSPLTKMHHYSALIKTVYRDDNLIILHPSEMLTSKTKLVQSKNTLFIEEICRLTNEYIDCTDSSLYLFIFIENKEYFRCIYKGYFKNILLLVSPIFIYKFKEHLDHLSVHLKQISNWYGSFIIENNNYDHTVLNRMQFQLFMYHIGGLQMKDDNKRHEFKRRIVQAQALSKPSFSKCLLTINILLEERNRHLADVRRMTGSGHFSSISVSTDECHLTEYEFTFDFKLGKAGNIEFSSGAEQVTHGLNIFPPVIDYRKRPCYI